MNQTTTICFILLVTVTNAGVAQEDISFERLSIEHGLSHSTIEDIIQDKHGYMWFATANGLNRYDGYQFNVFYHDRENTDSLSSSDITALIEDSQGNFWVGTSRGLNLFNVQTAKSERFFHSPDDQQTISNNFVRSLFQDSRGVIWVGTRNGLNRFDRDANNFHRFLESDQEDKYSRGNEIYDIYEDSFGDLYVGTSSNTLDKYDPYSDTFTEYTLPNEYVLPESAGRRPQWFTICEDAARKLWFGIGVNGLFEFDRKSGTFIPYSEALNEIARSNKLIISDIEKDNLGNLWFGFDNGGGLVRITKDRKTYKVYKHKGYDLNSIGNDTIYVVYKDASGLLWIGHQSDGVTRLRNDKFLRLVNDPFAPLSLSENEVLSVYGNSEGILWIGHANCIDLVDLQSREVTTIRNVDGDEGRLDLKDVSVIKKYDENNLLVNTSEKGILILNKHDLTYKVLLEDPEATNAIVDNEGNWWVSSSYNGLYKVKKTGATEHYIDNEIPGLYLADTFIHDLLETPDGSIWLATIDGLMQIKSDPGAMQIFIAGEDLNKALKDSNVRCLYYSNNNSLWVGTTEGLYSLDIAGRTLDHFTEDNGLSGNEILNILEDNDGYLWLTTNGGVTRFSVEDFSVTNFSVADGLQSREFRIGARFKSADGTLYFGGLKGLNFFEPGQIIPNEFEPNVAITSFRSGSQVMIPDLSVENQKILELDSENRDVELEFSGFDYTVTDRIQYRYQLLGYDRNWREIADKRHAVYTNLPFGHYTFEVMCTNSDGIWSGKKASLSFYIQPAIWETWWFQIILVLMISLFIVCTFWVRETYARTRRRKLEQLVEDRTREVIKKKEEIEIAYTSLEESEEQFRTLFENSSVGIYRSGPDGELLMANKVFLEIVGFSDLQQLKSSHLKFSEFHNNCLEKDLFGKVNVTGELKGIEFVWSRKDGKMVDIRENLKVAKTSAGEIAYIEGNIEDVTDIKRAEEEAKLRQSQLIQSDKLVSLGRLVSGIAHEINNPNLFINSNASVLVKAWKSAKPILDEYYKNHGDFRFGGTKYSTISDSIPEMISGIREGSGRIKAIVSELRDFAGENDSGMTELVDFNSVIKSAITIVSHLIKQTTDNFVTIFEESLPKVHGNYQKLEQVVINLLTNACQALQDSSKSIEIKTCSDENTVTVTIRDEGIGIPTKDLDKICEPFFTTKRDSGGTGLGLSISSTIIKEHEGILSFESVRGTGTAAKIVIRRAE